MVSQVYFHLYNQKIEQVYLNSKNRREREYLFKSELVDKSKILNCCACYIKDILNGKNSKKLKQRSDKTAHLKCYSKWYATGADWDVVGGHKTEITIVPVET